MGKNKNKNKGSKGMVQVPSKPSVQTFTEEHQTEAQILREEVDAQLGESASLAELSGRDKEEAEKAERKSDLVGYLQYLKDLNQRLAKQRESQDAAEAKVKTLQEEAQSEKSKYEAENKRLVEKDRELTQRAVDLDNGDFSQVMKTLLNSLKSSEEEIFKSTEDVINELTSKLVTYQKEAVEITDQKAELIRKQAELEQKEKVLKRRLELVEEDREAARLNAKEELDDIYAMELSSLKSAKERLERENERLKAAEESLTAQLSEIFATFSTKEAGEMLAAYKDLQKRVKELKAELNERPYSSDISSAQDQIAYLEKELQKARQDSSAEKLADLKVRLFEKDKMEILISNLKDQIESKDVEIDTYIHSIEQLKHTIEVLNGEKKKIKDAFETARIYDDDDDDIQAPITSSQRHYPEDLYELAIYLQKKMASSEKPFYYKLETIRVFLAGLYMTPITILQGISGTGKTSLPREFAKAMVAGLPQLTGFDKYNMPNAPYRICAIQSGWRDNMDLMGYYNSFDSNYKETDFFKALYLANQPKYKHTLFLIILDEMNLSRPEHYFADFLSMLEQPEDERYIGINAPQGAWPNSIEGGKLRIPKNVRFIGTANHDETTLEFAPKTYDRSNVIEMPRNTSHDIARTDEEYGIPYEWLERQFQEALEDNKASYAKFQRFISDPELLDCLSTVGIGVGNRFEAQAQRFICAYLASGDNSKEDMAYAADHLITSRLFRSLKNRYNLKAEQMKKFRDDYEILFESAFHSEPVQARELIDEEIKKK